LGLVKRAQLFDDANQVVEFTTTVSNALENSSTSCVMIAANTQSKKLDPKVFSDGWNSGKQIIAQFPSGGNALEYKALIKQWEEFKKVSDASTMLIFAEFVRHSQLFQYIEQCFASGVIGRVYSCEWSVSQAFASSAANMSDCLRSICLLLGESPRIVKGFSNGERNGKVDNTRCYVCSNNVIEFSNGVTLSMSVINQAKLHRLMLHADRGTLNANLFSGAVEYNLSEDGNSFSQQFGVQWVQSATNSLSESISTLFQVPNNMRSQILSQSSEESLEFLAINKAISLLLGDEKSLKNRSNIRSLVDSTLLYLAMIEASAKNLTVDLSLPPYG